MRAARRGTAVGAAVVVAVVCAPGLASAATAPDGLYVAAFGAPASLEQGQRAAITGRVAPAAAVPVRVERLEDGAWTTLVTLTSSPKGLFSARLPLARTSNLRVSVQRADGTVAVSRRRSVALQRRVSLEVRAAPLESIAGRPFTVSGAVRPAASGEKVALQGSVDGAAFRTITTLRVRSGRVAGRFTPPRGGSWRFRIAVAPTAGKDAGGAATTPAIRVFGNNPHGVPASAPHYLVQKISELNLYYYERGKLRRVFPVVFGKASTPTPIGRFAVYSKTYGPGPAFGPRALWYHGNYGIHGTNQEHLLDDRTRYYSAGCTRNYNENILWLWPRVPVGTPVINLA